MISAKIFSRCCIYVLLGTCFTLFPIYSSELFSTLTDMRLYTLITAKLQEEGLLHFQNTHFFLYIDDKDKETAYLVTSDGDLQLSFEVRSIEDDYTLSKVSVLPDRSVHRIKGATPGILKIDLTDPSCLNELDTFFNNMAHISLQNEQGNEFVRIELPQILRFQEDIVKKTLLRESLCQGMLLEKQIHFEEWDRLEDNFVLLRRGYYRGF